MPELATQEILLRQHYEASALRERIVEHRFVADVSSYLWDRGVTDVEILRSEYDGFGYDLVIARGHLVRHVQLKAGLDRRPVRQTISTKLADKPSGCLVYLEIDINLALKAYWFFGEAAGVQMASIDGYHPARKIQKPTFRRNHVKVPNSAFRKLAGLEEVVLTLLGNVSPTPMAPEPAASPTAA